MCYLCVVFFNDLSLYTLYTGKTPFLFLSSFITVLQEYTSSDISCVGVSPTPQTLEFPVNTQRVS